MDIKSGSRLGPLLFITYINDIVKDIESEILIFADDTTLLTKGTAPAKFINTFPPFISRLWNNQESGIQNPTQTLFQAKQN